MRKFINGYLVFCGLYYLAFFGAHGFFLIARRLDRVGYERGLKSQRDEVAGLKLALETLTKKPAERQIRVPAEHVSVAAGPKLVVANA